MTSLSSNIGLSFKLTGIVGQSVDIQTAQYIRKRIENILYIESPPADAVLLSYAGTKEITPDNNLYIGDRSDLLYANCRGGKIEEYIGSGNTSGIYVKNINFIVTQKFNSSGLEQIPLYYKCVLPSTAIPESIKIFDKNFNEVGDDTYLIEADYSRNEIYGSINNTINRYLVFNNLKSDYNRATDEYNLYFIQYADSATDNNTVYTSLLNNELAYSEATFDDIWSVTLELKPWGYAYTLDKDSMSIGLPTSSDYAIKYEEAERLSVKSPTALDDETPWFLRVTNNSFDTSFCGLVTNYSIPEFENQAFSPYAPYKTTVLSHAEKVDDHIIRLQHTQIQNGDGIIFSYFYLLLKLNDSVEYAITNNPSYNGSKYRDEDNNSVINSFGNTVYWSTSSLLGIDNISGFVHISPYIKDSYDIYATYSYKENMYTLSTLNMNPLFDSGVHNELRCIYIVPASLANSNLSTQTQSIYWVRVSRSGKIIFTNQDGSGGNKNINFQTSISADGYMLSGIIGLHYNYRASCIVEAQQDILPGAVILVDDTSDFPSSGWIRFVDTDGIYRYSKYIQKTTNSLILSSANEVPCGEEDIYVASLTSIDLVNFIDEYTTMSVRNGSEEIEHTNTTYPAMFARYFVLAEVSLNPPHAIEQSVLIDVRKNGGGIIPSKYEEAKLINPRAQWFSESQGYAGQTYPGNAVVVIKVPTALLDTYSKIEIEDIVKQSVSLGIKPIIRYYGYMPNIIYVGPTGEE